MKILLKDSREEIIQPILILALNPSHIDPFDLDFYLTNPFSTFKNIFIKLLVLITPAISISSTRWINR